MREHGGEPGGQRVGCGGDGAVPVADAPLVAEVRAPQPEDGADALADPRADGRFDLRRVERRVLVVGGDDLARLGVRGQPCSEDAAGGQPADDRRAPDDVVDEAHEVVAHVVERVAARACAWSGPGRAGRRRTPGSARRAAAAPARSPTTTRSGPGISSSAGFVAVADDDVVHLHLAEVGELLRVPRGRRRSRRGCAARSGCGSRPSGCSSGCGQLDGGRDRGRR